MLKIKFYFVLFVLLSCCGENSSDDMSLPQTTEISTQQEASLDTTTSTTSTTSTVPECIPQDNSVINFENVSNIQNFLNRNGFNAGVEDGFIGNQTINAIRSFQETVGLMADGDAGPMTIEAMKLWTGCEKVDINLISSTTTVPPQNTSTTTTTTTVPTTTTTIIEASVNSSYNFFYQGFVSLENGNFESYLTTNLESDSFCSLSSPNQSFFQKQALGMPIDAYQYSSMPETVSEVSTQIVSNTSDEFSVEVVGNGDENFRFYFIEPFTSSYKEIIPRNIKVEPGKTTAIFSKINLRNGYWFYGYADNGGGYVKATGLKEILVGNEITQEDVAFTEFSDIWINSKSEIISNGRYIDNNDILYLNYITDRGFNSYSQLSEELLSSSNSLKIKNADNYGIGNVILINKEYLYVTDKSNATLTVERGYRNSVIQNHSIDTDVKKLVDFTDMRAVRGYATFKGEKGFTFTVPLLSEGIPIEIKISDNCPKDLYSLDYIKVFSWRAKGKATVITLDDNKSSSVVSKNSFTVYQGLENYLYPDIFGINSENGEFLNSGPKNKIYEIGDYIEFNFAGITKGIRKIDYIEIEFKLIPTGNKKTKFRSVIFVPGESEYIYRNLVSSISTETSFTNSTWESGYKYFVNFLKVNDGASEVLFYSNGDQINKTTGASSKHDFYYLDQFVFDLKD